MLEKGIKLAEKGITAAALAGTLMFNSGCVIYKTIAPESIQPIKPLIFSEKMPVESIDYRKLSWQEAIEVVQTPEQAQDYLDRHFSFDYEELSDNNGAGESFKYNHYRRKGICLDYATVAAALLSDNNYPPLILIMQNDSAAKRHALFIYKTNKGFGALGVPRRLRLYSSIDAVVDNTGILTRVNYTEYSVVDLDLNFSNNEWISGEVDMQMSYFNSWVKVKK